MEDTKSKMNDGKCAEDAEYLQELKRLRDHEAKNERLKKFLDSEVLISEKRMQYHALSDDKKKVLVRLEPLNELLEETSRTALRQDLVQMMLPLRKEVQRLTDEVAKLEMTKAQFRSRLIQCEEMLALLLYPMVDESEPEKDAAKPVKAEKKSPWLMLCQAETGLDAHQSGLPTTTLTQYAFDESREYAKIYVDLPGLEESDHSKLRPTFSERHFSLLVADVQGRNYKIHFANLTEAVDVDNSKIRPKKDRMVVFLKKKQPITWRSLTSSDLSFKKEAIQRVKEDMLTRLAEEFSVLRLTMLNSSSEDEHETLMQERGVHLVRDVTSANKSLATLDKCPPKLCCFQWHDTSPGAEDVLRQTARAVARHDCFVMWDKVSPWPQRRQNFDDELLEIITNGKCQMVNFRGRLSRGAWRSLPPTALQVNAIVTCAEDVLALTSCPTVFEQLYVTIERQLPLSELKPLRPAASVQPIALAFCDVTDGDVEWLLRALGALLPLTPLPNLQQVRQAWRLVLHSCQMSPGGHLQVLMSLPQDVVAVMVQDYTDSPHVRALGQMYALRSCYYLYMDKTTSQRFGTAF